ncbi:MAG: hypothetical protein U0V03_03725 [Bacteroidia bacterium]|jgi:hypothetical protein
MLNKKIVLSIILFVIASNIDLTAQCAMCKAAAESSLKSDSRAIARGLNSGILYLMTIPYILLAFIFKNQIKTLLQIWFKKKKTTS